ncbi:hypothetical protein BC832DRAFT_614709 [Gaertneriomyces semiglobifer]|nr:hypothetical protein BC832DRAFT_614709 [Gaertneriomyces semiglobifer]
MSDIARPSPAAPTNGQSVSLYQGTMSLIEKLYSLPGFDYYLFPDGADAYIDNANLIDPVAIIWGCFRLGSPLCHLYNQLRPRKKLTVPELPAVAPPYNNSCKKAVYEFVVACKAELQMGDTDLFSISGLYKDDTNEFVKLMKTITIVVQKIEDLGLFPPMRPLPFSVSSTDATNAPADNRAKLIAELLNTERIYTADLEKLQRYQRELQSISSLPRDTLLQLFANLDELLDFQRRFLLQMEATLSLPPNEQRVGQLFMQNEDAFAVYIPFCGNYQSATQLALEQAITLQKASMEIDPVRGLPSYLIKPVQRVCKYPLLLNELIKYTDQSSYLYMNELREGLAAVKRVTDRVNEEKRKEENQRMKADVFARVEDWKGLSTGEFGQLLLSDKFPMSSGDAERDYDLFLFEHILLCCKDTTKKRKSRKGTKDDSTAYSLKGNIYIDRIDSVGNESDPTLQKFQLKVYWRDGMDMESFVLRCRNAEQVKLWEDRLTLLLEAERMKKLSLRESNPYTRSTQLHPDIVRGFGQSMLSPEDTDEEYSERRGDSELPPPIQRSKSIPNNYYPGSQRPPNPLPRYETFDAPTRKSAPAQPRNMNPGFNDYLSRSQGSSRARSSSPPLDGRMPRDSSPPPPVPQLPSSPPAGMVGTYENMRARERSRSRHRGEERRPVAPQVPLPEPPGNLLTGYGGREGRRSARQDRGYFDNYYEEPSQPVYEYSNQQRPVADLATDFPPSPPTSVPSSPSGRRKMNVPPIMTARSVTAPYPSSAQVIQPNGPYNFVERGPVTSGNPLRVATPAADGYYRSQTFSDMRSRDAAYQMDPRMRAQVPSSAGYQPPSAPLPPTPLQRNGTFPMNGHLPSTTASLRPQPVQLKVKMHYGSDIFVVAVPSDCTFSELQARVDRKIRLCGQIPEGKRLKMRYRDEVGDLITINTEEDVLMAFDRAGEKGFVSLWIVY